MEIRIEKKIIRSINRSQSAYKLYLEDKFYFQALRIYKSNLQVYGLLNEFVFSCEESILSDVLEYIFHLDDWFLQFKQIETQLSPDPEDLFVFERLSKSIAFPYDFSTKLNESL
jgi:hypothetical protein